ncbi:MAG TPA: hypothetical protein VHR45_11375 [Thermoanaerobaculia bacterium]|nr:hypothetical protein [Thermoanaerobaculia bacterium]
MTRAMAYRIVVYDNFHYMDESESYERSEAHADCASAVAACQLIVDEFLLAGLKEGISADELFAQYTSFGEDPTIVPPGSECCEFSAWTYAKQRCQELCRKRS